MPLVTPTQAIALTGRSKASFYKDIAAGKVSKTVKDGKSFFDTSELVRAYGELRDPDGKKKEEPGVSSQELINLKNNEIALLRELVKAKDEHIESLREALLRLEYRQSEPVQENVSTEKKGFLGFFGRKV